MNYSSANPAKSSTCAKLHPFLSSRSRIVLMKCITIRSRAKSTLSINYTFYIRKSSIFQKNTDPPKKSTYIQYLTVLSSIMSLSRNPKNTAETLQPPKNGEILISPDSTPPTPTNYERIIAHAAEVKFISNRYTTPITFELGSSELKNSVNLPVKHRKSSLRSNSSTLRFNHHQR